MTEYGHAAFVTINENNDSVKQYVKSRYYKLFGEQSGTLFLIDMDNRMIQFYSDGKFASTINNTRSNEITDNIYKYATDEKYFECANEAFNQVNILLRGGKISTPMRHVTNVLMAVCLGLLVNFLRVSFNRERKVSIKEINKKQVVEGVGLRERTDFIKNVNSKMISQKRNVTVIRHPIAEVTTEVAEAAGVPVATRSNVKRNCKRNKTTQIPAV